MLNLAAERAELVKADRDIAAGERRIAAQRRVIVWLRDRWQDTGEAEHLLVIFQQTLETWKAHRVEILRVIARLEAEAMPPGGVRLGDTGPDRA